jgi:hypothetical protein
MIGTDQAADSTGKKTFVKASLRKAICLAWKGNLDEAKALFSSVRDGFREALAQEDLDEIDGAIKSIEVREASNSKKQ